MIFIFCSSILEYRAAFSVVNLAFQVFNVAFLVFNAMFLVFNAMFSVFNVEFAVVNKAFWVFNARIPLASSISHEARFGRCAILGWVEI